MIGALDPGIRESARMAYDYLRANGKKISMDRDVGEYDVNLQVMSLSAGKDATQATGSWLTAPGPAGASGC
jgi:ATP-dependent Lon protease